ncbi:MAG TPA: Crp/Fnr family transcriptional regulator [Thermoanaerobaculia bacterium]
MSIEPRPRTQAANRLIDALVVHERNAVLRVATLTTCTAGQILLAPGERSGGIFFPAGSVLALVRRLSDGSTTDVALIGHEGVAGGQLFVGATQHPGEIIARSSGAVLSMSTDDFRHQFDRRGDLHDAVLRFTAALISQLGHNGVCSGRHPLKQRVARWLMMLADFGTSDDFDAGILATSLAEEESAVLRAIDDLARAGAVRQRGRRVSIHDAVGLEMNACECAESLRQVYGTLIAA